MGFNQCTIVGNVGADPEMRYTANGKAVAEMRIAVNERYGEQENTTWFKVICWERLAESVAQYVTKGREVLVSGAMRERSWDSQDGAKHYAWELIANNVQFLQGGRDDGGGQRQDDRAPAQPAGAPGRGGRGAPPARGGGRGGYGRGVEPDALPF